IVAETLKPGTSVSTITQRYGMHPSQLFAWRKAARDGRLVEDSTIEFSRSDGRRDAEAGDKRQHHHAALRDAPKPALRLAQGGSGRSLGRGQHHRVFEIGWSPRR